MTFSIVARDAATGAFGVATATGGPVVGSLVPYARAGVGAIATQGQTNALYGFDGLEALAAPGAEAAAVLDALIAGDAGRDRRQVIIVDGMGRTAMWTGAACGSHAAARAGVDVAVAGNLLAGAQVLTAMLSGFESAGPLEDRLLAAMQAGQAAGGDRRGTRSAALKVYSSEPYPLVDIRCDWSTSPVSDLAAVLKATREEGYEAFLASVPSRANPDR